MLDYAMTCGEIAEELGISKSRVERIEKIALKKIGQRFERYIHPPKQAPVLNQEEMTWEAIYDRLYRESRKEMNQ
jgi:transcriptional regulator